MRKILLSLITVLLLTSCATQGTTTVTQAVSQPEPTEFVLPVLKTPVAEASPKPSTAPVKNSAKETPTAKADKVKEVKAHKLQMIQNHMVKHGLSKTTATRYAKYITSSAAKYNVDPYLILAIIQVETGATFRFENRPNSHGAIGLMQILKSNAKWMGINVSDLYNPQINIDKGTMYLKKLQKRFGHDKGIIAYNQGEGNVSRGTYRTWYLKKVNTAYSSIKK